MNAPDKIYVGITDGKHYSIVGEGYPYAKEYVSVDVVAKLLEECKRKLKFLRMDGCFAIDDLVEKLKEL